MILGLAFMFAAALAGIALALKALAGIIEWGWDWRDAGWFLLGCLLLAVAVVTWAFLSVVYGP